jgi:antitoxin ParD1/3/4
MRIENLGAPLERFIEEQVASGRYESADHVVREALHRLQDQEREIEGAWSIEELRREIQKGIDSGPSVPAEEVFARLKDKYRRMGGEG